MDEAQLAIGGSRLVAAVEEAERTERARLADALHDDALQRVLAAKQELQDHPPSPLSEAVEQALDGIGASLRSLTAAMQEDELDRLPLTEGLERIAASIRLRGTLDVVLEVDPDADGIHDAAVRSWVRELLANAVRHARATVARVHVRVVGDDLEVTVSDDGRGLQPGDADRARRRGNVGLQRLERIAGELGGRFSLSGPPGTTATVAVPLVSLDRQRTLQEQLGRERRWSSALVAAFQDALVVVRGREVVQVNDAFLELTGFTREELLGAMAPDLPFWRRGDEANQMALVSRALQNPGFATTTWLRRADGSTFEARCTSQRIEDELGGGAGVLVVVRDQTERRLAERRSRMDAELGSAIETTRRLSRLQHAASHGPGPVLDELGALLIEHLGWTNAVVNLCIPGGYRVAWTSSGEVAATLQGATYTDDDFGGYLQARFLRAGAYVVPEEAEVVKPGPSWEPAADGGPPQGPAGAERPGDVLLVPMRLPDDSWVGLVSVDGARSGLRPSDTELEVLCAVGDHAATALRRAS